MKDKPDAIIQARLGSTRLPKKVLREVRGKPLIAYVVERLRNCSEVGRIIVATTDEPIDDELVTYCEYEGIDTFRGDSSDVLSRFIGAATAFGSRQIVRVCSDNPFLDAQLLARQISASREADYCTYVTRTGEPLIMKPLGLCAEIVTTKALEKVRKSAIEQKYREHVTMFIYENPESFHIKKLELPDYIDPELRFTVDFLEDLNIFERIVTNGGFHDASQLMLTVRGQPELEADIRRLAEQHPKIY